MTPDKLDDLTLLGAANPVLRVEPLDEAEQTALVQRIISEPASEPPRRVPQPPRSLQPRRLTLAGAGALALAAFVVVLAFPGGKKADAIAQAVAALSGRDGVFHVVTRMMTVKRGGTPTTLWTETWASADGRRNRSLLYRVASDGNRGRLIGEKVGNTTKVWAGTRHDGPISDGGPAVVSPRSYTLALLRQGRVTSQAAVTIGGREASRFVIETRLTQAIIETPARYTKVPAYTVRTVLIVDRRTHLPLLLRTSGVEPTIAATRNGRVTYPRQTSTARFSRFERLTAAEGAAGLKPSRRFRRR